MVLIKTKHSNGRLSTSRRKLFICFSLSLLLMSIEAIFLWINPLESLIRYELRVANNSVIHMALQKDMDGLYISTYLFNITNGERFLSGQDYKLKLEEVGPFTYREIRRIKDIELDMEAGVIRYTPRLEQVFVPELSIGAPEDVILNMPNIVMLTVCSWTNGSPFTRVLADSMLNTLNSKPVVEVSAQDIMWGYYDPIVKIASKVLPGWINFEEFGILDRFFDEEIKNHMEVSARDDDKFMIKKRNGLTKLKGPGIKNVDECSSCDFNNTYEGMFYPVPVRPDTPIRMFRAGFCKILDMVYHETTFIEDNIETLIFNLSDSFYGTEENNRLLDLSSCLYDVPVAISKHHLLDVNPKLYERIDGMKPDPNRNNYIAIQPNLGMEVDTSFVIQFNLRLKDIYNTRASKFSNMILPLGYVEFKQEKLKEEVVRALRLASHTLPLIYLVIRIVVLVLAICLLAYSILLFYRAHTINIVITTMLTTAHNQSSHLKVTKPLMVKN